MTPAQVRIQPIAPQFGSPSPLHYVTSNQAVEGYAKMGHEQREQAIADLREAEAKREVENFQRQKAVDTAQREGLSTALDGITAKDAAQPEIQAAKKLVGTPGGGALAMQMYQQGRQRTIADQQRQNDLTLQALKMAETDPNAAAQFLEQSGVQLDDAHRQVLNNPFLRQATSNVIGFLKQQHANGYEYDPDALQKGIQAYAQSGGDPRTWMSAMGQPRYTDNAKQAIPLVGTGPDGQPQTQWGVLTQRGNIRPTGQPWAPSRVPPGSANVQLLNTLTKNFGMSNDDAIAFLTQGKTNPQVAAKAMMSYANSRVSDPTWRTDVKDPTQRAQLAREEAQQNWNKFMDQARTTAGGQSPRAPAAATPPTPSAAPAPGDQDVWDPKSGKAIKAGQKAYRKDGSMVQFNGGDPKDPKSYAPVATPGSPAAPQGAAAPVATPSANQQQPQPSQPLPDEDDDDDDSGEEEEGN